MRINALTRPGDKIVIATPVYTPFFNANARTPDACCA